MSLGRQVASALVSAVVVVAVLGGAPPANAASSWGTVTWDGTSLSPSSLPAAAVGDTFTIHNSGGALVTAVNSSGQVSFYDT